MKKTKRATSMRSVVPILLALTLVLAIVTPNASSRAKPSIPDLALGRAWAFGLPGLAATPSHFCSGPSGTCVVGDPATAIPWGKGTPSLIVDRVDEVFLWFRSTDSPTSIYQLGWDGRIMRVISGDYAEPKLFSGTSQSVSSVAADPERGYVYFVTGSNNVIVRVDRDGNRERIAGVPGKADGDFGCGKCGDGGDARKASVLGINSIDVDKTGRLLIADGQHYKIRSIGLDGVIHTLAGTGENYSAHLNCRFAPCGQSGKRAQKVWFTFPGTVVGAPDGSFWFSELNSGDRFASNAQQNRAYGFQPLWHVDRQGYAHAIWTRPFATFTLDPRSGNPIVWDLPLKQGKKGGPVRATQRIIEISRIGKRVRQVIGPPRASCVSTIMSLTCGDGHRPPLASLPSVFPQTSQAISVDTHGGLFLANAGEARYFSPPSESERILGFTLARPPAEQRSGTPITIPFLANTKIQVTARIAPRTGGAPQSIQVTQTEKAITWNGLIVDQPPKPGKYVIELTATDAQNRISTRQLPALLTAN